MATIDYRLKRRAILRGLEKGFVSRPDVCDAHPELMRAAKFLGEETDEPCPVCDDANLRLLFYAYGKALKRENGRVRRRADLVELRRRVDEFAIYVVEVCTECSWNHLIRSISTGRDQAV